MSTDTTLTRRAGDLTNAHLGRTVTVAGLTGTLLGLIPMSDRVSLVLDVGGSRAYTEFLPNATTVEVARAER